VTASRPLRWLPWVVAFVSVLALALAAAAGATTTPTHNVQHLAASDAGWWVAYAVFSIVGAIVTSRRPDNRVGWLMLVAGAFNALAQAASQYAIWGLVRHPGSLPGASVAAWVTTWTWSPAIAVMVLVLIYFPNGRLPSRRWQWLPWVALSFTTVIVVSTAVNLWPQRGVALLVTNADVVRHSFAAHVIGVLWPFIPVSAIAAMVSLVVRYRRGASLERQQLKWLVFAGAVSAPMIVVGEVLPQSSRFYTTAQLLNSPAWCAIAIALAILRYRLYDIDRIVSRTVSYAVVTGVVIGVYVGVVALIESGLGFSSSVAVAASTLAAAALFQPVRRRVQTVIDRRFNRRAYDAGRIVETFSARLREEVDVDTVRRHLLDTVDDAVAPATASLWLVRA